MKLLIVLSLVALAVAAPPPRPNYQKNDVQLLKYENDNTGSGNYKFSFEQNDGTKQEQDGKLINKGSEDEYVVVRGFYSWIGPDGVTYIVTYTADKNGYQPEIEELPGDANYDEVQRTDVPFPVLASLLA